MHRPTVHDIIVDTGGLCAFFRLLFRLVAGKFHKAGNRLFVEQRFAVLLNAHAVVYFIGEDFRSVRLQVGFNFAFFIRFRI